MLDIETKFGTFSRFQDILTFMTEEKLKDIEIVNVEYCLKKIYGKGIYTIKQIQDIVRGMSCL